MVRFHINVNVGDKDETVRFFFIHKDFETLSDNEQNVAFDKAVKELNHIYKDYGRFATQIGVTRLFEAFGFERSTP